MLVSVWFGLAACGFLKKRSSYWKIVLLHKIVHPKVNSDVDNDDNDDDDDDDNNDIDDNDGRRRIGQERNLVMSKLLQQQQRTQNLYLPALTSTHSHIWKHTRTHLFSSPAHAHTQIDLLSSSLTHSSLTRENLRTIYSLCECQEEEGGKRGWGTWEGEGKEREGEGGKASCLCCNAILGISFLHLTSKVTTTAQVWKFRLRINLTRLGFSNFGAAATEPTPIWRILDLERWTNLEK